MALDYILEVGGDGTSLWGNEEFHKQEKSAIKPILKYLVFSSISEDLTSIPILLWLILYDGFFLNFRENEGKKLGAPVPTQGLEPPTLAP